MTARKLALILVTVIILSLVPACNKADRTIFVESESDDFLKENLMMLVDRGNKNPATIARELELAKTKLYEDYIDLGTSYIWLGDYRSAAEAQEMAARYADTKEQMIGALYLKSVSLAYSDDIQEALNTIDLASSLDPENIEVAKLRYALYLYSTDNLGRLVAGEHLIALDPSQSGVAILDPTTTLLVIVAIISVTTVTVVALVPPEDRKEAVGEIMHGYAMAMGAVFLSTARSPSLPFATLGQDSSLGGQLINRYNEQVKK